MPKLAKSDRILRILLCGAMITTIAMAQTPVPPAASQQPMKQSLQMAGLHDSVQIVTDRWGIPHIYAQNEDDLFFAQGYNVAKDRLFQLELWRRQASGTVAEILGKKELQRDIGNRLFQFRGNLEQELNWYHPHGAAIVQSFVNGINAYIDQTAKNQSLLPPEFKMLGIKPQHWTPAIVISRFNGLLGNADEELNTALAVRAIGADKVKELEHYQPANPDLTLDPAIDSSLLNQNILALYHAFRTPLRIGAEAVSTAYRANSATKSALQPIDAPNPLDLSARREDIGSNNWVVSPKLSASGFPLMMNDPHRVQQAPSLRYYAHLVAPGWDVIGAGEPSLPGISIGHNDHGAWGLTIFGTDSEDIYVYDTDPANPNRYRYRDGWQTMTVVKESIPVKDEKPADVELKYTVHGPVLFEDYAHHKAYALRAAWTEVGGAPYLASLRMDQSTTWPEFRDACSYSRIPAENMVWADRAGNIGYQAVGIAPLRPNWSGLVPVPGDGRYEWAGYLPIKALPNKLNPDKGYFNTANSYILPQDWLYKDANHYTWADPYRTDSAAEFLGSGRDFTVADMEQLQNNELSLPARSLVPLLRDLQLSDPKSRQAAERLLQWNNVLDKDSVAAGIYEMWQRRLLANIRDIVVPKQAFAFIGNPPMTRVINWLLAPDGRFGADPIAGRDALLARSLDQAIAELTKRFGADSSAWTLGSYHHAEIFHPLSGALNQEWRAKFNVGDLPRGGDSYTVNATGGSDNQTAGGSFKIVVDTENWDNSVGLNNPGQSGDINSTHYRDLYSLWAKGRYFPVFYSREKVDSVAESIVELQPPPAK